MTTDNIQYFKRSTIIIPANSDISEEIICLGKPAKLYLPAGFQTSDLTFLDSSSQGGSYTNPLKDNVGDIVTVSNAAAGDPIALDPAVFEAVQFFKIKCSVTQSAQRQILVIFTPLYGNYVG